jgi:hypothetical protein
MPSIKQKQKQEENLNFMLSLCSASLIKEENKTSKREGVVK